MNPPTSLVAVVQSLYAAFGRGDIAAILARVDPQVEWQLQFDPAAPGVAAVPVFRLHRGPAGVGEFFAGLARDLEFHVFNPVAFFANDTGVVARVQIETTVRKTQRRSRVESMHHFTFNGAGRLTHFAEFTDTLAVAHAWGAVRAAG